MSQSLASRQVIAQASTLADRGHFNDALLVLERLVQSDPKDAAGWAMLCSIATNAGDTDSALVFAQQAVELEAGNADFRASLCTAQFNSRQLDNALSSYLALCKAGPQATARIPHAVRMALRDHAAKGGVDGTVRPLTEIIGHAHPEADMDDEALTAWLGSAEIKKEAVYFKDYPEHSLIGVPPRVFLYHCVRTIKPKVVVEIGTFKAGTAEIIARALWENRGGTLYTTDPFGGHRCPAIIGSWPEALQAHVQYSDLGSMDFFLKIENLRQRIDMAFIDGNHDYEFAYFDLLMAARNVRRGGLVVMDNIEQQGPLFAVLEFLRNNPSWKVLGRNRMSLSALGNPMTALDRSSLEYGSIVILKAPAFHSVSSIAFSTGQVRLRRTQDIVGLRIHTVPAQQGMGGGSLYWEMIFREFPAGHVPMEYKRGGSVAVSGAGAVDLHFAEPVIPDSPRADQTLEVNFYLSAPEGSVFAFTNIESICASGVAQAVFS